MADPSDVLFDPANPPEFSDWDWAKSITAAKLTALGQQYGRVLADAADPDSELGQVIAAAAVDASGGFTDNGDGTITLSFGLYTDNGDGTITIGD